MCPSVEGHRDGAVFAMQGLNDSHGVVINEKGDGCYSVRVTCKDRRGLLADLLNTLKSLPLEVRKKTPGL
jgi:hypothetical protein